MNRQEVVRGTGAAPGIGIGSAWIWDGGPRRASPAGSGQDPAGEWERFQAAKERVSEQLEGLKMRLAAEGHAGEAALFDAHRLMLEDPALLGPIRERIEAGAAAEDAAAGAAEELAKVFAAMDDEYFRQRAGDVRDVGWRIVQELTGARQTAPPADGPWVIVARDMTPSQTAELDLTTVAGIVLEGGGAMSHAAILARARGLAAVTGAGPLLGRVAPGELVIVDGTRGEVILHPGANTVARYRRQAGQASAARRRPSDPHPAATADGHRIMVAANIASCDEAGWAAEAGADGIGLFRTEFVYMNRHKPPPEEEQVEIYRRVVAAMGSRPVVFRTLDAGGDKPIPSLGLEAESNPFLGWRGIRFCLDRPDIFKPQLRAMLQAVPEELWLMFPMVSDPGEVRRARELLAEAEQELRDAGLPVARSVRVGMMVETPAAAMVVDRFVPWVDFFSLGTNDLVQYVLGVDRTNPKVSGLYQPAHPAVLKAIAHVIEVGRRENRWVSVCGELAGELPFVAFFAGLGVNELSVAPDRIAHVKGFIRSIRREDALAAAQEALAAPDGAAAMTVLETCCRVARPPEDGARQ
ncbi:MAG: phosphoenolpyruvate--protein phosphotransferase [Firmicutes bacterium]|nr:phosphoenolpyruvate--protein phosphotransferase [Bacillota bacterium]